ncbi:ABC transporter permease [Microvirga ossetica]|jgi:putative spermidine/putrescine transport system permease protein|uniref:ABC transporter permease n=1 Tax=Microvirga ossetica TaxID=1882682 RepID=A0A1B2ELJ8_9HYPH|nr:ABC transporter permease [Microvirga ossetica]ANY80858.1 ABC transporter permease [Microvirga ossetica]
MESHVSHRERFWLYIFVGLVIFYLVAPTFIVVPVSFSSTTSLSFPPPGWSTRWYEAFFGQEKWIGSTWVSLRVAFGTMVLATVTGVAASYALHVSRLPLGNLIRSTLISPLAVPSILIAIGIFFVYARIGGMLNTIYGMILGHSVVAMPFVILTMSAGLQSYDMTQEMVARSLGANRFKAFMTVTLPQLKFSVATSMLLSFLVSFDELIISLMISSGPVSTLSRVTFATLRDDVDPTLAAVSTLMLIVTCIPPLVLHIVTNRAKKKGA